MAYREYFKLCVLCLVWYAFAAGSNILGKHLLGKFDRPLTVSANQHVFTTVLSFPLLFVLQKCLHVEPTRLTRSIYIKWIVPLAVLKVAQEFSGLVSIWKASVSYAQTVKALVPLFTVVFCQVIFRENQTFLIYLSLIPIMGGVGLATAFEHEFDYVGLLAGLGDASGFSLLSLFIKKMMVYTGMHSFESLAVLSRFAVIIVIPVWAAFDLREFLMDDDFVSNTKWTEIGLLLAADGILNFLQNVVASLVLGYVAVLTYAVANSFKRIITIALSFIIFKNPVKPLNVVGMCLAVGGVFTYSALRAKQNKVEVDKERLSVTISESLSETVDENGNTVVKSLKIDDNENDHKI